MRRPRSAAAALEKRDGEVNLPAAGVLAATRSGAREGGATRGFCPRWLGRFYNLGRNGLGFPSLVGCSRVAVKSGLGGGNRIWLRQPRPSAPPIPPRTAPPWRPFAF